MLNTIDIYTFIIQYLICTKTIHSIDVYNILNQNTETNICESTTHFQPLFFFGHTVHLASQLEMEPGYAAVEVQSPNH